MIEKIRESIKDIEFYNSINDLFINNSLNKLVIIDKSMIMKSLGQRIFLVGKLSFKRIA